MPAGSRSNAPTLIRSKLSTECLQLRPIFVALSIALVSCGKNDSSTVENSDDNPEVTPPAAVTNKVFKKWRDARRGKKHPQQLNNPYWEWILQTETSAWAANEHFGGPSSFGGNPLWEASRFGQSRTELPDGRTVLIAGEHEDHYDPDFFIYNDVAIQHPDGRVDFYNMTDALASTARASVML